MQEDFALETVLSIINDFNITDNYNDILELYCFMFENPELTIIEFFHFYELGKKHILSLYPELLNITFDPYFVDDYVKKQKQIFTDKITISICGEKVIKLKRNT